MADQESEEREDDYEEEQQPEYQENEDEPETESEEDTESEEEPETEDDEPETEESILPEEEENPPEEGVEGENPPVTPPPPPPAEQPQAPERGIARQNAVRPIEEGEAPSPIEFENIEPEQGVEGAPPLVEGAEVDSPLGVEGAQPLSYEYDLPDDFNYATYKLPVGIEVEEETYARTNYGSQVQREQSMRLMMDMTKQIYVGLNLFEEDLQNLNLDNKVFISCIFAGANITNTSMRKCVLYNCNLTRADMTKINLSGSFIYNCNMSDAICTNGNFSNIYCKYPDVDDFEEDPDWFDERPFLQEVVINREGTPGQLPAIEDSDEKVVQMNRARLVRASFNNAVLDNVSFMDAKMQYATLLTASCTMASFEYATLHEANFTNAICEVTVFTGAKAKQICFNNANLTSANCREADFRHGDFRRSTLMYARMDNCILDKAIIQNCDATSITLNGAFMRECIIRDTVFFTEGLSISNLSGVNLVGSILINCNLKQATLIKSKCCDVQFIGCNLNETEIKDASLLRTSFTRCDLAGINLNGTFLDNEMYTNFYSTGIITDVWEPPEERNRPYITAACERRPPIEPPNFENTSEELDPLFMTEEEAAAARPAPREGVEGAQPLGVEGENPPVMLPNAQYYSWDPFLEAVPVARDAEEEEEEEEVITDTEGNRIRVPQERDVEVINRIYSRAFQQQLVRSTPFNVIMLSDLWSDPMPTSLRYMNFKEVDLRRIIFSNMDLTGCNFFGARLDETNFVNTNLTQVNFQWADLINIDFTGATFEGDYSAGGLLEGASIRNCDFTGTILEDRFNMDTVISPYSPRAYQPDLALPAGVPATININGNGILMEEAAAAEGAEEEAQAQQIVKMSPILYQNPGNYIVLRVIEANRTYKDYIVERDVIEENLTNISATVFPCLKPFNMPGPSYPAQGQRSYHDITRPIFNIGLIIPRRVFVLKDIFRNVFQESLADNKMLVFFTDGESETVPTFVSQSVLNGANWMSELHCNSGAERETLWYVKRIDISEEELPVAAPVPLASPRLSPIGVEGAEPLEYGMEGEEPEYGVEGLAEPAAAPLDYVDPFGSDSESSTDSAPPTPEPVIPYLPIFIVANIPIAAPLNTSTSMGNIVRQGMVLPSLVPIAAQLSPQIPTTTFVLRVVNGANTKNYLVKYNEFVEMFKKYNEDYYPCKVAEPVAVDRDDIDEERCLINIGKIIKQQIFVDKADFITMFLDRVKVRKERSYILQFNDASERVPAVIKVKAGTPDLVKRVVVWNVQVWPNDLPREVVAEESEPGSAETIQEESGESGESDEYETETESEASTVSSEPGVVLPIENLPPPNDDRPAQPDLYPVGTVVLFEIIGDGIDPLKRKRYTIVNPPIGPTERVMEHTPDGSSYNEFRVMNKLQSNFGFTRNSANQYFKNGQRYYFLSSIESINSSISLVQEDKLHPLEEESMVGGGDRMHLHGHNTTLRKHHHNKNNTLRRYMRAKKSRQLLKKFKKAFTKRINH